MGSWRFLVSRRWAIFAVVVALLAYAAWWLGEWQFDRLTERQDKNATIAANEDRPPAPVDEVLSVDVGAQRSDEWRLIEATGEYAVEDSVIVRYRSRDGRPGIDVVVPLVTREGLSVVVDRGFLETDTRDVPHSDLPAPPPGEVTITGWVRVDGTGDSTAVDGLQTRAINSERIGAATGRDVYRGFVDLRDESPAVQDDPLERAELPELDNGPHFFYGLQWWFFGVLALFGFAYLAYDERKRGPRGQRLRSEREVRRAERERLAEARQRATTAPGQSDRSMPPSTGSMTPDTKDAAGESKKAATRPNSSGSP